MERLVQVAKACEHECATARLCDEASFSMVVEFEGEALYSKEVQR
jgi:hypothetical protein